MVSKLNAGADEETPRPGRLRKLLAVLLLGLPLGFVCGEGILRFALFSDSSLARSLGPLLRRPSKYTRGVGDQEYFRLRSLWEDTSQPGPPLRSDAILGWRPGAVFPGNYGHRARQDLGGRRPFLMYGDSFTACTVPASDCWQGLVKRSDLSGDLAVVNYGGAAHGLGQIYLMLKNSIAQWVEEKPVVSIGILVDDDMDRAALGLRERVKPRFRIKDGELSIEYPGKTTVAEWIAEHPLETKSYLWALLVHGTDLFPGLLGTYRNEIPTQVQLKQKLARKLVAEIQEELESRDLDYFFILFEGPDQIGLAKDSNQSWRRKFLVELLDERNIPWVDASQALERDRLAKHRPDHQSYFIPRNEPGGLHYNALGNAAAWRTIERALHGQFDGSIANLPRDPRVR